MAREFHESSLALPETWPSVDDVVVNQTTLFYRLGQPVPLRDEAGRYRRDERGRTALEAFLGLPLETMYGRLADYLESIPSGDRAVEFDQARLQEAFAELIAFVRRFGPLGLGWSRMVRTLNPEADRLARENAMLRRQIESSGAASPPAASVIAPPAGDHLWFFVHPELGLAPFGEVQPVLSFPNLTWRARVRLDDGGIPHDRLGSVDDGPLMVAYTLMKESLDLADALAGRNPHRIRDAIERFSRAERVYVVDSEPIDPTALNWRRAVRGVVPADGMWEPLREHRALVDWETLGWTVLAQRLSRVLTFGALRVGLRGNRPQLGWRVGSLVEVMYLQLLGHVAQHPHFGIGQCTYCAAPILRVRHGQRWHSGCAPAGRQRESRASRKARATVDPGA